MLSVSNLTVEFGGKPLFEDISFLITPTDRIGLVGKNGAGKSTLIKLLSGESEPLAGTRMEARGLAIGYFAQHQLEQLRPDESPLWHMANREPRTREQVLRDYLGGFDFRGKMAESAVAPFSGGEKSLTVVALMVAIFKSRPSPFYVLDEVEAALDDVNLGRLLGVLEDLRANSQLIIITHQKRTMEIADALYGVTMRGDGVTEVISQRLREVETA